jgi:hypothetical protein
MSKRFSISNFPETKAPASGRVNENPLQCRFVEHMVEE